MFRRLLQKRLLCLITSFFLLTTGYLFFENTIGLKTAVAAEKGDIPAAVVEEFLTIFPEEKTIISYQLEEKPIPEATYQFFKAVQNHFTSFSDQFAGPWEDVNYWFAYLVPPDDLKGEGSRIVVAMNVDPIWGIVGVYERKNQYYSLVTWESFFSRLKMDSVYVIDLFEKDIPEIVVQTEGGFGTGYGSDITYLFGLKEGEIALLWNFKHVQYYVPWSQITSMSLFSEADIEMINYEDIVVISVEEQIAGGWLGDDTRFVPEWVDVGKFAYRWVPQINRFVIGDGIIKQPVFLNDELELPKGTAVWIEDIELILRHPRLEEESIGSESSHIDVVVNWPIDSNTFVRGRLPSHSLNIFLFEATMIECLSSTVSEKWF